MFVSEGERRVEMPQKMSMLKMRNTMSVHDITRVEDDRVFAEGDAASMKLGDGEEITSNPEMCMSTSNLEMFVPEENGHVKMPQRASVMTVESVCGEKHDIELRGVEMISQVAFTKATTSDGITPGNSQLEDQREAGRRG